MEVKLKPGVQRLKGKVNREAVEIYPELENLVVEPSLEEQILKSEKYGYNEVTVKAIESEELNITPSAEVQVNEGLFDKVTVAGDSNLVAGNIKQGTSIFGVEGTLSNKPVEKYIVRVVDYDGTIIKEEELAEGEVFTMPDEPQHDNLIFQGWSSPVVITNNTVTVTNNDIIIGPMYTTVSGASEFDIELSKGTGLDVTLQNLIGMTSIDWGDGIVDTELIHTYTDYGDYTIKVYGVTEIRYRVFNQDGSNTTTTSCFMVRHIRIADTVTIINESFRNLRTLETITLPKELLQLKEQVFRHCSLLKAVIVPENVTSLGYYFCGSCTSLTNVVIPLSVTEITGYGYAFTGCKSLFYINIPENVTSLQKNCFDGCENLKRIVIPKKVSTIPEKCFYNCLRSEKIVVLGEITSYGRDAFYKCAGLTSAPSISNIIGEFPISLLQYCEKIKEVEIPEGITKLGNNSLANMRSLKKLTLPNTLIEIGDNAIQYLDILTELTIPESVAKIGTYGLSSIPLLEKINIPPGVTEILAGTFQYDNCLRILDFSKSSVVPTLANANAIPNNIMLKIVVPDELYDEWIAATNWSTLVDKIYKASEVLV